MSEEATQTSFIVQEALWKKFEKHIFLLKYIGKEKTKQSWLMEAVEEKLSKEEYADLKKILEEPERRMAIFLNDALREKIDKQIELARRVKGSYSKKQLITEAIMEKLERERDELKDTIKNIAL